MAPRFTWHYHESGIEFVLEADGRAVSIDDWSRFQPMMAPEQRSAMTLLLRYYDDATHAGDVQLTDSPGLLLSHQLIASPEVDGSRLLLPPAAPFSVAVDSNTTIERPDCRLSWKLVAPDGRVATAPKVQGCLVTVGRKTYLLKDPLYSLIHGIVKLNQMTGASPDERMLMWSGLTRFIPDDAEVARYLRSMRVTRAESFTLDIRTDDQGHLTFDPVLVTVTRATPAEGAPDPGPEEERSAVPVLSPFEQESFAQIFRRFQSARPRYVLGNNQYVVLEPALVQALSVVRNLQQAEPEVRRQFVENPYRFLRQHFEELVGIEPDQEALPAGDLEDLLDRVFYGQGYGERVRGIGLWQPKVLPWLSHTPSEWLPEGPPRQAGLLVGGRSVPIEPQAIPQLLEQVQTAIQRGEGAVDYQGTLIPANPETVDALKALLGAQASGAPSGDVTETEDGSSDGSSPDQEGGPEIPAVEPGPPLILLIHDNLENTTFTTTSKQRRWVEVEPQSYLVTELKPHQREGIQWLVRLWISGRTGALLADDMGLGKTLQALAFLKGVQLQNGNSDDGNGWLPAGEHRPILVVAPTGLLNNWLAEHDRHLRSPGLGIPVRAYGSELRRLRQAHAPGPRTGRLRPVGSLYVDRLQSSEWVLTTYETLRDYHMDFARVRWSVIVFDEAQRIKDPTSLVTDTAKAMNAEFILAITGTPVENRLADLWCIVDTVQPGLLGDLRTFIQEYEGGSKGDPSSDKLVSLRRKIDDAEPEPRSHPKVMLRRTKFEYLPGLPPRTIEPRPEPMEGIQLSRYNELIQEARSHTGRERGFMLQVLQRLRQVSLHPLDDDAEMESRDDALINASARFRALFSILDEICNKQEKALIFLDDLMWQQRLRLMIQRRYQLPRTPLVINGSVSGERRKARVDDFQAGSGFDVMLMTPRAGGVGLTLTAANHVIHLSRWWNPAVEDQATDRVYRIGQTRPVFVYYPMAIHPQYPGTSFDERLHEHLERKRQLSRQLLVPSRMNDEDIDRLFTDTVAPKP